MRVKVLGCSGGIGGRHLRTTSFLVDRDIFIDAGTGVNDVPLVELSMVNHVFLTHSHLDHIACLPLIVDTVGAMRDRPLIVYALQETIDIIQAHIFNWKIWPDFSEIPSRENPFLSYRAVQVGETIVLGDRRFTVLPAVHTVPAVGYHLDSGVGSWVFTGDTWTNDLLWKEINLIRNLRYLVIETAFCNQERDLADASRHLCPDLLATELAKLSIRAPDIYITHLKPGEVELTMLEIEECVPNYQPKMLQNGHIFDF